MSAVAKESNHIFQIKCCGGISFFLKLQVAGSARCSRDAVRLLMMLLVWVTHIHTHGTHSWGLIWQDIEIIDRGQDL